MPAPTSPPCQVLCSPPSGCSFLTDSRNTTHKGFHFARQTTPSSGPPLSPRSPADWAAPAMSNTAAAADQGLTPPPRRSHCPQRSWSTAGRGKGSTEGQPSRIRPGRAAWEPVWKEPKNRRTDTRARRLVTEQAATPRHPGAEAHTGQAAHVPDVRAQVAECGSPNSLPQGFNHRLPRSAGAKLKREERWPEREERTVSECLTAASSAKLLKNNH